MCTCVRICTFLQVSVIVFAKNSNINVGQNHSLCHEQMLLDELIGRFVKGKATGVVPRAAASVNARHSFPVTVVFTE